MNPNRIPLPYSLIRDLGRLHLKLKIADGVRLALHDTERDMSSFGGLMDGKHYPVTVERASTDGLNFIPNYLSVYAAPMSGVDLTASIEMPEEKIEAFEADVRWALDNFNASYQSYGYSR